MSLASLSAKNLFRNKFRSLMTMAGVAVAILGFILLRTVIWAWNTAAEFAAQDRIATRHKVTFVMTLPKRYIEDIRNVPGVTGATWLNWFGGKDQKHETEFFANFAVDHQTFLDVYDELSVSPEAKAAWLQDRQGALIGAALANKFGWKVGDTVVLTGTIFPGEWQFHVSGIYEATRKSFDRSSFIFRWDYLNDSLPEGRRDQIGWSISRIKDASQSAAIAGAVDKVFDDKDTQTLSMSEHAMNASFMGMMSAVLRAVDVVSIVILAIMMLILGNTIAMGVRERTNEYGVLRALGFMPGQIAGAILTEAGLVGLVGGGLGLALAYPLVEQGMGRWLEENMGAWFPYFRIAPETAGVALFLAVLLGVAAAVIPAYRVFKIDVVSALRRVG